MKNKDRFTENVVIISLGAFMVLMEVSALVYMFMR